MDTEVDLSPLNTVGAAWDEKAVTRGGGGGLLTVKSTYSRGMILFTWLNSPWMKTGSLQ